MSHHSPGFYDSYDKDGFSEPFAGDNAETWLQHSVASRGPRGIAPLMPDPSPWARQQMRREIEPENGTGEPAPKTQKVADNPDINISLTDLSQLFL